MIYSVRDVPIEVLPRGLISVDCSQFPSSPFKLRLKLSSTF
jgi:hypothetical protein